MPEEEHHHEEIQYRGAKLSEEEQENIEADIEAHKHDVTHVQYRGAEGDIVPGEHEKHTEHIQYRGAEDDVEVD